MSDPWTPGPWSVDNGGWCLTSEDGPFPSREEMAANMRLAALAPEMAELLVLIANHKPSRHVPGPTG